MKKAIIVGGSKGLGLALAKKCESYNILPVILARSVEFDEIKQDLPQKCQTHVFDILNNKDIESYDFSDTDVRYVFITAGVFLQKSLIATTDEEIEMMTNLHFNKPLRLLRKFYQQQKQATHLVMIASCSSWRLRSDQSIYTSIKAAQATFARNLAPELARDNPNSKITLINPGGLKTPNFHKDFQYDIGSYLDPNRVAEIIWNHVLSQKMVFKELQILRPKGINEEAIPIIEEGPRVPEIYME